MQKYFCRGYCQIKLSAQQPEPEEFAWLIDEYIQQRITVIATSDRQLIELNKYELQERAKAAAISQKLDQARRQR